MFKNMEVLNIFINDIIVGRLTIIKENNLAAFEYGNNFIKDGFSISPFYLPLKQGVFVAKQEPFNGMFGVFNDSLPDGWGQLLIDRFLINNRIDLSTVTILDRLSIVGDNGKGALTYKPQNNLYEDSKNTDINYLAKEVKKILNEDYTGDLAALVAKGGSSGGARPKVCIKIDNEDWIVKFPSSQDIKNIGEIEYLYSTVAKKCSINMPETKLIEKKYFAVKRFDRDKNKKIHMHSAAGLLYASHRLPSLDYIDLINLTLQLTKDISQAVEMFRLMVFNILTYNNDDHSKNFSFLYKDDKWILSPAYDLVYSTGFNNQHTTTVAGKGIPTKEDIFVVAKETEINKKTAMNIFDEIFENTRNLRKDLKIKF